MTVHQTYEQVTFARARVLGLLASGSTIRQVAETLGCTYNGARSQVRDLERILDCSSVEEVRAWWVQHAKPWLAYAARSAGLVP